MLAELPAEIAPDRYGDGGVVEELETHLAHLLGKPAAAFFVSGTMAQQIALRIHADRRSTRTVAFHPTSHIDLHEGRAFERLHGLIGRPVGDPFQLLTLESLEAVAEPLAALLLELPQREIGGQLPEWEDLTAQVDWARERGAAVHLDGARLWQCPDAYQLPLDEIAGLFDTVYVSFYKDLGLSQAQGWPVLRTSSPRPGNGGSDMAAPCSPCGPTPPRHSPVCGTGYPG
jgi:threonine aldolase